MKTFICSQSNGGIFQDLLFLQSLATAQFLSSRAEIKANEKQAKCKQNIFPLTSNLKSWSYGNSFLSHSSGPRSYKLQIISEITWSHVFNCWRKQRGQVFLYLGLILSTQEIFGGTIQLYNIRSLSCLQQLYEYKIKCTGQELHNKLYILYRTVLCQKKQNAQLSDSDCNSRKNPASVKTG